MQFEFHLIVSSLRTSDSYHSPFSVNRKATMDPTTDTQTPTEPQQRPPLQQRGSSQGRVTPQKRMHIISVLVWDMHNSAPGKNNFHKGVIPCVAKLFHVTPKTIRNIWTRALDDFRESGSFSASPRRPRTKKATRHSPRLRKGPWDHDPIRAAIDALPLDQKKTSFDLAIALGLR
jgi:hypothetical protein